jgi:hypothetical protein
VRPGSRGRDRHTEIASGRSESVEGKLHTAEKTIRKLGGTCETVLLT